MSLGDRVAQLPTTVWLDRLRIDLLIGNASTDNAMTVLIDHSQPGWWVPEHRHENEDETIVALDGVFELTIGECVQQLRAGEAVFIPRKTPHRGRLLGSDAGRRLVIFTPGGMEHFFLEVGTTDPNEQPDSEQLMRSALRHGWRFSALETPAQGGEADDGPR